MAAFYKEFPHPKEPIARKKKNKWLLGLGAVLVFSGLGLMSRVIWTGSGVPLFFGIVVTVVGIVVLAETGRRVQI